MYIVAIAWLYVVLMMALTETSVVAGIATFVLYGLAPLSLFLWLSGRRSGAATGAQPASQTSDAKRPLRRSRRCE